MSTAPPTIANDETLAPDDPQARSDVAHGVTLDAHRSRPLTGTDREAVEDDETLAPETYVDDYVVESLLGRGMFGTVYAARHAVIEKPVAIKVLARKYSSDREMVARFIDEARAASHIAHPDIIEVFGFGRLPDGRRYSVMERLEGEGLDATLAREGAFDPDRAMSVLHRIASALTAAHAAGVTHRDVKPANIYLCADGRPKLLDFGVAKLLGMPSDAERTATGVAVGTPAYMAPEQCIGRNVGPPADVYALGVLAFQLLSGRLPFEAESSFSMMTAHLNERAPALHRLDKAFAAPVSAALRHMMHKDPAARPTPLEGIDALGQALGVTPGAGRARWAVAALVALAALVGLGLMLGGEGPPADRPAGEAPAAISEAPTTAAMPPSATGPRAADPTAETPSPAAAAMASADAGPADADPGDATPDATRGAEPRPTTRRRRAPKRPAGKTVEDPHGIDGW